MLPRASICLLLLIFPGILPAEEKPVKKVGYIDLEYVFQNSKLKNTLYKKFLEQKDAISSARKNAEVKLSLLRTSLRAKEAVLGHGEYLEVMKQTEAEIQDLEKTIQETRDELSKWEADLMASVFDELIAVFRTIAEEKNLDLILSRKTAILYGENGLDFSQEAIDLLNEIEERNTPSAK